ncbi:MAG: type II toxin-antitoxin system PemK/MazF family toxin [Microcoleaceae cyanobacterium]
MAVVKYPQQFDIYLISLDPTVGSEIQKTRPCVIISPDEMNKYLNTVIIAPMTTVIRNYPTRINLSFDHKDGQIVLDQIRTVDKNRLIKKIGDLDEDIGNQVLDLLIEIFTKK